MNYNFNMKIYIGADHTGFDLKEKIRTFLSEFGYEVEDCGAYDVNKDDDYPDFISKVASAVSEDKESKGIVIGGSGQGEAMLANKFKGVRCALFYSPAVPKTSVDITGRKSDDVFEIVGLARDHNDANVLSLSARFLTNEEALEAVKVFLDTPFKGEERHVRRIEKIKEFEKGN